jgi:hypothetical protein
MRLALAKVVACQTCTYRPRGRQRLASLVRCLRRLLLASDCNFSRVDRCVVCWDGRAGNVLSKLAWKRRNERTRKRIETNGIGTGTTASAELSVIENRKLTYAPLRIAKTRAVGVIIPHPLSMREALGSILRPSIFTCRMMKLINNLLCTKFTLSDFLRKANARRINYPTLNLQRNCCAAGAPVISCENEATSSSDKP